MRTHLALTCLCVCALLEVQAQWQDITDPTTTFFSSVHYRSNGNVWIGGIDTIRYSLDHGDNIIRKPVVDQLTSDVYNGLYNAVHAFDNNNAIVAGPIMFTLSRAIYQTTNAGTSYTYVGGAGGLNQSFRDIDMSLSPIGLVVGDAGAVYRTTNGGASWSALPAITAADLTSVAWLGGSTFVAGGTGATIRSTDSGATWQVVVGPTELWYLASLGGPLCYGIRESGEVWKSLDGGSTWSVTGDLPSSPVMAMEVLDATTLIVSTTSGGLFRSHTSGQFWEQFELPDYKPVRAIDFYDADHGIAVGNSGYVLRTANGGGPAKPMVVISGPSGAHCTGVTLSYSTPSDPAYGYQWLVDGIVQSTGTTYDYLTATTGAHTIAVVADNGQLTDTAQLSINVAPTPIIPPFQVIPSSDTTCPGTIVSFTIPIGAPGVTYQLRNGFSGIDSDIGNGGPITFSGNISFQTQPDLYVRASWSNSCGSAVDTVPVPFVLVTAPAGVTYSLTNDSSCYPVAEYLNVQNSVIGWQYSVNGFNTTQVGTGGALQFPVSGAAPSFTTTLYTRPIGTICAVPQGPGLNMKVFDVPLTASGVAAAVEGSPVTFSLTANALMTSVWDFGAGAMPAGHTGLAPPAVTYTGAGSKTVTITGTMIGGLCTRYDTLELDVIASAPAAVFPTCSSFTASGDVRITDMHVDNFGSVIIGGERVDGSWGGTHVFQVARYNAGGALQWSRSYVNQGGESRLISVTGDLQGNTYATVHSLFAGTMDGKAIGVGKSLVKFDVNGVVDWVLSGPADLHGLACTPDNTIYVLAFGQPGSAAFTLPNGVQFVFPPDPADGSSGAGILMGIKPNGTLVEAVRFGRNEPDAQPGQYWPIPMLLDYYMDNFPQIDVLDDGSLVLSGIMAPLLADRTYHFGDLEMTNNAWASPHQVNSEQVFIARYEPLTGFVQATSLFGSQDLRVREIAMAPDSGWYVLCNITSGFAVADSVHEYGPGQGYGMLLRTDAGGAYLWHVIGERAYWTDLVVNPDGSTMVHATFSGLCTMASVSGAVSGASVPMSDAEPALLHYSAAGELLGVEQGANAQVTIGMAMDEDMCGNAYVATASSSQVYAGSETMPYCNGACNGNITIRRMDNVGCGGPCFPGVPPGSTDLGLDAAALDNTALWPTGPRDLSIDLSSWGDVPITSATIAWQLNDDPVQTFSWSGNLAFSDEDDDILIGTPLFGAQLHNTVSVWLMDVNGTSDDDPWNDTLRLVQTVCPGTMAGTYTVGGPGADFPDHVSAMDRLSLCGISDNVVVEYIDSVYQGVLRIDHIPGTSPTDTVIFRSASGDSSAVRFAPGSLQLDSASHVTVQDMSFASSGSLVYFSNNIHDVNIIGCTFTGVAGTNGQTSVTGPTSRYRQRMRFINNTFRYGKKGISIITSSSVGERDSLFILQGNVFDRQFTFALEMRNIRDLSIMGNTFLAEYSTPFTDQNHQALFVNGFAARPVSIIGNTFRAFGANSVPNAPLCYSGNLSGNATQHARFINNMVLWSDLVYKPSLQFSGDYVDVVHNTFSSSINASGSHLVIRNNIISNGQNVPAVQLAAAFTDLVIDHNIYNGFDTTGTADVFSKGNTDYELAQWRAQFGFDLNSFFGDPMFVSNTDYHLAPGNTFQCPAYPGVVTDIDGDPRSTWMPRHGADEGDLSVGTTAGADPNTGLVVLPNPNNGQFALVGLPDGPVDLCIVDAQGRIVYRNKSCVGHMCDLEIDLAPGVYHANAVAQWSTQCARFIVSGR